MLSISEGKIADSGVICCGNGGTPTGCRRNALNSANQLVQVNSTVVCFPTASSLGGRKHCMQLMCGLRAYRAEMGIYKVLYWAGLALRVLAPSVFCKLLILMSYNWCEGTALRVHTFLLSCMHLFISCVAFV